MDLKRLGVLFRSTFTLSMFTVGGGYVIVPLMRKQFVNKLGWIQEEEMLDLTAIAQSTPGAMAVNASILVGYRISGIIGAFVAIIGTVLPPLIIITLISIFYAAFRSNLYVSYFLKAMQPAVAAIIVDVVMDMGKKVLVRKKVMPIIMMFSAFSIAVFTELNIIAIILVCGIIGGLASLSKKELL